MKGYLDGYGFGFHRIIFCLRSSIPCNVSRYARFSYIISFKTFHGCYFYSKRHYHCFGPVLMVAVWP